MNQFKLLNNTKYDLVTNGVVESEDYLILTFIPGLDSFETIETELNPQNTENIYILGSDELPVKLCKGFTHLVGMSKKFDYVISSEMVNTGTEKEPYYETDEVMDTVIVAKLRKPNIGDTVKTLQDTVDAIILSQLEV